MSDHDVVVVGQGGIGSAASYWLARRGASVLGVEQFEPGHRRGGSEDHSRIIRMSYHTPFYVELAGRAYRAWAEVSSEAGEDLVLRTGGLDLAPANASIGLESYRSSMAMAGVGFEELDRTEIVRRWPQFTLSDDVTGLYQEAGGIAKASIANAAHRRLAADHGAHVLASTPVTDIREVGDEVEVVVDGDAHRASAVVIAAGAWTNRVLAGLGVSMPLEVTLEQVVYLRPADPRSFAPGRFPVWIWMDEPSFYGFPVFGEEAVKVAWDRCTVPADPDTRRMEPDPATTDDIRRFAASILPDVDGGLHSARTCLYTLTPDRDFVIDRVPGTERCFVAVGAGHAFKFASLIGRILSELALDGFTDVDLVPFAADRAVLSDPDPPRTYMI